MKVVLIASAAAVVLTSFAGAVSAQEQTNLRLICEARGKYFEYDSDKKSCIKSDPIWKLQPGSDGERDKGENGRDRGGRDGGGRH